ncbi:MAG: DUF362 domain-containing protein [Clostridia bacterium]
MSKAVFLDYIEKYDVGDIKNAIREAFDILRLNNIFKPKMKVLIKACLPESASQDMAKTSHPAVITALVHVLTDLGLSCVLADSPYKKYSISTLEELYLNTGMLEVANLTTCELNHNLATTRLDVPNGKKTKSLQLLDVINHVDMIINVGKIKIDANLGYCGACQNIFGLIPGEMKTLIKNRQIDLGDYNNYIIDMLEALNDKIVLNVLDGIVALENEETPRMLSCIGLSTDPYALDASVIDILGIDYKDTILKQASERGFCEIDKPYRLVGEKIEKFIVEDFALSEFDTTTTLESKAERTKYFNANQRRVKIDSKICKGCGVCSKVCPTGAIMMKYDKFGELYAEVNYDKCIFCYKCHTACPYQKIDIVSPLGYKRIEKEINKFNTEE